MSIKKRLAKLETLTAKQSTVMVPTFANLYYSAEELALMGIAATQPAQKLNFEELGK
ncbi:hypothetical protein [Oceanisphaera pacifica]|uniref:Uncharacterized protein n=1 Tax=Oceanisphaera pacifica TaxID=2818389 RepID=A0ABS3NJP7_9GAMM|nr:hypothetical protein [Oceanisphaera pacifica]MBO1520638.1 hypothetical protein [Oceanisphaera pacifica]